ncbi:MAG TPA: zinc ribbon domain-containing protein [Candidatus Deferrimicrobium sp.]|nr:zinc ribbon domain-containing protein [Candidatus Deferrimicrobium sp.]
MAENSENFVPYSSPMGIPGSSYMAQVGKVGDLWALRLVKGREVLEMGTFDELNGNKMIAFIIQNVAIPMINPYQISQSVKALIRQAERGPLTAPAQPAAAASMENVEEEGAIAAAPSVASASDNACPRCRRPIQANFFFCPYCSQKLREFLCVACKKEIRLDYKMCPYCGSVLGS